ncbi:MAG: hypothetical protein ACREEW_18750 [Caulobacteraceae bacterium]
MTFTIAISGTSGAGKSSLARAAAALLDNAALLHFDDYEYPPPTASEDIEQWIATGLPLVSHRGVTLADAVAALREGRSIEHPNGASVIAPTPFLVIEEPLGRARPAIAPLIDMAVLVATPADLALARRLRRDIAWLSRDKTADETLKHLQSHLEWYATGGRAFYERMVGLTRLSADMVLDGELSINELAQSVAERAESLAQ